MSIVKTLIDKIKSLSSSNDATGKDILMRDSNGNIVPVSIATLTAAVCAAGNVMRVKLIPKNTPLNADDLYEANTVVTVSTDMANWNTNVDWINFPTSRPAAGFTLFNIQEGLFRRQIYSVYMDSSFYTRYFFYQNGAKWSVWYKIATQPLT